VYALALHLAASDEPAAAQQLLRRAGALGHAAAASAFTWHALRAGQGPTGLEAREWLDAISAQWEETSPAAVQNVRSNLALCALAAGEDSQSALDAWVLADGVDHPESTFFPAVLALRSGDLTAARTSVQELSPDTHALLEHEFTDERDRSVGWFHEWCVDCLTALALRDAAPSR
jgi:hypothetical protein